ncbi:hypothetical protein [Flavobacterium haoranii]|uniref:Beta-carotene 15,15'-monooxygenase n=1 Tax=Flavobacterium haoranii TaxID=683124 RepID=A0A1M6C6C0_9FLAO|nr:hypothetical protein [Flavobacterium haoranii]SHI56559.1 hypothetical protein SAMN05444337_0292 [Flavobacterium haoranii]
MQESITSDKITLTQYGFQSATNSQSNPESIDGYLNKVYDKFLEDQKLDETGVKNRISRLREEVILEKSRKNDLQAEITTYNANKIDKENEIQELELERIDIKNGEGELGDTTSFIIGAFITILLTLYLFVFYSSSGYSSFYGIKQGSLGFINANVFSDALNRGGGVFALIILFPVIFLGLGFLIHNALEENKGLVKEGKSQKYNLISVLLFITFIADAFIGYKIAEGVHNNEFNAGRTNELWNFNMIFSDINFYLVLILGFVVYVIWGFLLNYVLSHSYLKTENEKTKIMLGNINNRIQEKRNELNIILSKIAKAESDILSCNAKIEDKEKNISGYETGDIPINISTLKAAIGEFMGGWQYFTNGNFNSDEALKLNNEAIRVQTNWMKSKIENLNA